MITQFDLIFTGALKNELPYLWLEALGYSIIKAHSDLAAIKHSTKKVLFVVTGVGADASQRAAQWLRAHFLPKFVVNIGTAGAVNSVLKPGTLLQIHTVFSNEKSAVAIDSRTPFYIDHKTPIHSATLFSIPDEKSHKIPEGIDAVDMEAYSQAQIFQGAAFSFHCFKVVSDRVSEKVNRAQFKTRLPEIQNSIQRLLQSLAAAPRPFVSVIIPVYNRKDRIAACVESVLNQSLPAQEVIVVDDGSTEDIAAALAPFNDAVQYIRIEKNKGVSAARNTGAKQATSEWLAFLDSDDLWQQDKLALDWQYQKSAPFYALFQSDEIWIRNGKRVNPCKHHQKSGGWIWERSLNLCLISPSAVMIRRDLFWELDGFDETLPACEDYDLWLRLCRMHATGFHPAKTVIKHGGHSDQLSRKFEAMDQFRVTALQKALANETDPHYRALIEHVLQKKLTILMQGAEKRRNGY